MFYNNSSDNEEDFEKIDELAMENILSPNSQIRDSEEN